MHRSGAPRPSPRPRPSLSLGDMPGVGDEECLTGGDEVRDDEEDGDTVTIDEDVGGGGVRGNVIVDKVADSVSVDVIAVLNTAQPALSDAVMAAIVKKDASAGTVVVVVTFSCRPKGPVDW